MTKRGSMDDGERLAVRRLSLREDLRSFLDMVHNYADVALRLHRRHGDVIRRRIPRPTLWMFHPRHVRHVLRTNVRNYPKSASYELLRPILGQGLFVSDGELWTRQRRILAPEFRATSVARFLPVIIDRTEELLDEWARSVDGPPRDITDDMMRLTLWVVGGAMFKSDLRRETEVIGRSLEICLHQGTLQMFSMGLLRPWMPTPGNLAARRAARELDAAVSAVIARGRAGEVGELDVLSRLLVAKDPETGASMGDAQILDEVKSLILAGHETTSLTLAWNFYLLAQHPHVEARLAEEARRVLGDRPPRLDDVHELVYTRMVVLETMRLYPPVPAVPRVARDDDEIDGIRICAGHEVVLHSYAIHRHPALWDRPDQFDPERFAPARIDAIDPYAYFPFLRGRRACLGEHFAMLEAVVTLAMMVRRFHLARVDERPIDVRPISTLRFSRPLCMQVHPR